MRVDLFERSLLLPLGDETALVAVSMPPLPSKPVRRFNLGDAMILIAATAVGLGLMRTFAFEVIRDQRPINPRLDTFGSRVVMQVALAAVVLTPLLAMLSVAVLILRLRRPRPLLRKLTRQPGMVASLAATIGVVLGLVVFLAYVYRVLIGDFESFGEGVIMGAFPIAYAVAAAWGVLAIQKRWRAERHWLDRLGRVLGAAWLFVLPCLVIGLVL
jgi:hypothetical protein